ncbi:uncharacterized protein LOC134284192 [Aedes albopictus]|uniref:CCHC-type domain-containing protein n=1 Tax=Aedes albopictus TaxID=7160 RepID=A0ABM1ZL41_AEDAL
MDAQHRTATPPPRPGYSCVACKRPDSADNIVACDTCSLWWHYTCAGVTDSVRDQEWTCRRCLPAPTVPQSVRSTTSSRRAILQMKRLAEQQELERKQLELERKQLELQKKHSQEKFDLEETLAEEEDNRSVRSRVIEIESREKQVSTWIDQHTPATNQPVVPASHVAALTELPQPMQPLINNLPDEEQGAVGGYDCLRQPDPQKATTPTDEVTIERAVQSGFQQLQQQLAQCQQQPEPTLAQIQDLEAQLQRFRIQLQQRNQSTPLKLPVPSTSKGAIPKAQCITQTNRAREPVEKQTDPLVDQHGRDTVPLAKSVPMAAPLEQSRQVIFSNRSASNLISNEQPRSHQARSDLLPHETDSYEQPRTLHAPSNILPPGSDPFRQQHSAQFNYYDAPGNSSSLAQPQVYSAPSSFPAVLPTAVLRRPSQEQLAARQVMPRDLPEFSGDPEEWPIFFSSFTNSTAACGFSNVENLARLQRCLKGSALKSVRYYLLSPDSVPDVMDTLRTLYGRPEVIINRLIRTVRETPNPKSERLDSLIDFGMSVRNLTQHLVAAGQQAHLANPALLQELVEKLPANVKLQWAQHLSFRPDASLRNFSDFMSTIVESVSKVVIFSGGQQDKSRSKDKSFVHAHAEQPTSGNAVKDKTEQDKVCLFCGKAGHRMKDCTKFQKLAVDDRWKNVQMLKVCRTCLNLHGRRTCRISSRCGIDGCQFRHHQLLHQKSEEITKKTPEVRRTEDHAHHHHEQSILFRIIPIKIHGATKSVNAFAFLDEGSSATLVERSLVEELGIEGPNVPLCLKWTANMTRNEEESQVVSLEVSGVDQKNRLHLVNVRTVESLNLPNQTLRFDELQKDHPHLKGLPIHNYENATPKLLVGLRNLQFAVPLKVKQGRSGVIATKTRLGWCVYGSLDEVENNAEVSYHVCECEAEEKLEQLVKEYFNAEDCGVRHQDILESDAETRARKIMEATTRRIGNRFETGLVWKTDIVEFPDSFPMALRRLQCLERRMDKDPLLKENIHLQVQEYQQKGFAHLATEDELAEADPRRIWYLPLGAVYNPKKPGKVRLIWDAAAKVDGISLNSLLLPGPDLLVSLVSVQFLFRQYPVAVSGDIKEMFHQMRVIERDRPSQSFLFRYIMDVLTFGAASSPTSAQFVKNRNAQEFANEFPRAADAIIKRHYVDDYLDSFETIDEAKTVSGEVKWIHAQGGFEIRNWSSNQKAVLDHLGEAPKQETIDLSLQSKTERVLGMLWCTREDVLCFSTVFKDEMATLIETGTKPTKRQVLKCIMSLFDPLGLLACVLVHGKVIMQSIWRSGIKWDECIDENVYQEWTKWIGLLDDVSTVKIPRCYFHNASLDLYRSLEAHVFVDASEAAYAAVVYFRIVNQNGTGICALVSAKTKVAPLRYVSIPRLELMAAVLGVRLFSFVRDNHSVKINRAIYWSDSEVTLAWIRSEHRKYRPFVACRVGEILSSTNVKDWRHVPSKMNVSDEATKWTDGLSLGASSRWFNGPAYLQLPENEWPKSKRSIATTDEELRACHLHQESDVLCSPIDYSRFSNWNRLLRTTAYMIRFGTPRSRNTSGKRIDHLLTHEELKEAEILLWKLIQSEAYPDEIAIFSKNRTLPMDKQLVLDKSSPLWSLTPMLDENGILRIDSRITAAQGVAEDLKFPIILPRKHSVTILIVNDYHRKFLHGNSETVANEIRQRFYVAHLRTVVKGLEKRCQN